ncbi:MAG: tRNA (adenosine(37)-N6)-dimethylallyltransferase MiaA [Cyanothece sp. SIO1E1]|nr:tRNA (adenosine(37)-N6)-dimethylallyltransferase MiaA [Cyanothece sp. SIO1E1]
MSTKKFLIIVGGPTASGKTGFAIRLAQHFRTEIISLDSRQFYEEMDIGTAKPSQEELASAPHHFVGHISIQQAYSVGDFVREALARLERLFGQYDILIATGGSGLYIKSLCEGLDEFPDVPAEVKKSVSDLYEAEGITALQTELERLDPDYFEEVDLQNPHRLMRAISVCRASGRPFSSFQTKGKVQRNFTPIFLQMHWPRRAQYDRINKRVDLMIEAGQVAEARRLYPYRALTALQTVGYKELFSFIEGESTLPESIDKIKRNSRRYAKRQLTWMRRDGYWKHFHPKEWEMALTYIGYSMDQAFKIVWADEEQKEQCLSQMDGTSSLEDPIEFLTAYQADEVLASIPMIMYKKELLLLPEIMLTSTDEAQQQLLRHEALNRSNDQTVYQVVASKKPPTEEGSIKCSMDTLPGRLTKWVNDTQEIWKITN